MKSFTWQLSVVLSLCLAFVLFGGGLWLIDLTGERLPVIVCMSVSFCVFAAIAYTMVKRFTKPLGRAVFAMKRLADGDYHVRVDNQNNRVDVLTPYINDLAEKLEKTRRSFEVQRDQLETLIENTGSPLIFMDEERRVIHANELFKKTFRASEGELDRARFDRLIPNKEIQAIVDETFSLGQTIRRQVVLPFTIERRHFDVYAAPISSGSQRSKGVIVVFHDITELKKLEKMRRDFVANVSHELKTPVTSIKGFAETLLEDDGRDEAVRRQFLQIVWMESERLESLIKDLLELSKIEQEGFELHWRTVDLKAILEETMLVLNELAEKNGISFVSEFKGDTRMDGDPYRLKQMTMNILTNAITYSPPNRTVSVVVKEDGNRILWETTDQGIGIDEKEIPRIFERFYRVDRARSRDSGGTGLGLAIVKHLAEAHGADIQVESRKGVGTTFLISFKKHPK